MNKVAAANNAAYELVRATCLANGVPTAAITRNVLREISEDDGEDIGLVTEPESLLSVTFMDGRPSTIAMALSPKRYELQVPAKVAVVAIGDEELGRVARIALIDAIAAAFDAEPSLSGTASWAEMADDPDQDAEEDMGAEARIEIVTFDITVVDALTPRG